MKVKNLIIMRESEHRNSIDPADLIIIHRTKNKSDPEYVNGGNHENVHWDLYKGFENYFLKVKYQSISVTLTWDGVMWLSKEQNTAIYGVKIEDISARIKEVFAERFD